MDGAFAPLSRDPGAGLNRFLAFARQPPGSGIGGRIDDTLAFWTKVHHFTHMIDWSQCSAVERIPGKVSGAWLFKNTRVPVKALFENIEGGATVQEFLEWFPGVAREQVDAVLEYAQRSLEAA